MRRDAAPGGSRAGDGGAQGPGQPGAAGHHQGAQPPLTRRRDGAALPGSGRRGLRPKRHKKTVRAGELSAPHRPSMVRQQKIRPIMGRIYCTIWWRRRESNPRPPIVPGSFYMLSRRFGFAPADFHWQNSERLARFSFRPPTRRLYWQLRRDNVILGALSRRRTPDASLKRLERSRSCRHLWFSYPFNERTGPRHATYSSLFTSKPLRPLNLIISILGTSASPPGIAKRLGGAAKSKGRPRSGAPVSGSAGICGRPPSSGRPRRRRWRRCPRWADTRGRFHQTGWWPQEEIPRLPPTGHG
jgi:hypothetical protein